MIAGKKIIVFELGHVCHTTCYLILLLLIDSPETIPEKLVYFPTVGSVVGAWLGSIVIPLDWDRPWQVRN